MRVQALIRCPGEFIATEAVCCPLRWSAKEVVFLVPENVKAELHGMFPAIPGKQVTPLEIVLNELGRSEPSAETGEIHPSDGRHFAMRTGTQAGNSRKTHRHIIYDLGRKGVCPIQIGIVRNPRETVRGGECRSRTYALRGMTFSIVVIVRARFPVV